MNLKPLLLFFSLCLTPQAEAQTSRTDSLKSCDAFCQAFTQVLQDRTRGFTKIKGNRKSGKGRVSAGVPLPGATKCTVGNDYNCTYDLGTHADSARGLYRDLNNRVRELVPSDWIAKGISLESMGYSDPNQPLSVVKISLLNTGGGDDPWSGRVYPDSWHVMLVIEH